MRYKVEIWVVDFLRGSLIFLDVANNCGWVWVLLLAGD